MYCVWAVRFTRPARITNRFTDLQKHSYEQENYTGAAVAGIYGCYNV